MPTLIPLPPSADRLPPAPWLEKTSQWLLRQLGWSMRGEWPDLKKMVIIAAPHTSIWDVIIGLLVIQGMGLKVVFMGKKEAFFWPAGPLLRHFGGMSVDRSAPGGIIEQAAGIIRDSERLWFALAPEGTRKPVEKWKTGFWKIAKQADVPVCCAYFHFPDKVVGIGPVFHLSEDMDADIAKIRAFYAPFKGKGRGV